jgi:hypothetical protein
MGLKLSGEIGDGRPLAPRTQQDLCRLPHSVILNCWNSVPGHL